MNSSILHTRRDGSRARRRFKFLAASCVASAALIASQAAAQTTDTPGDDQQNPAQPTVPAGQATADQGSSKQAASGGNSSDIVVTGFRASLQSSIATKRRSNEIVEVVSSEDIGKLPDVSIAESLARLPGLAGQRVNGRVQTIEVRGLPDQFTNTLLNGRQQVSSGDNRAAEFDQYPSELINSAVVYKTTNAGLVGQGLAGTVDMRAIRPLSLSGPAVALNARGEINQFGRLTAGGHRKGYRLSASFVDQFFDNTLGVAIGYAHLDSPTQVKHQKSWYWEPGTLPAPNQDVLTLGGQEEWANDRIQKRDGVMATIQWDPSDNFKSSLDLFYSTFKQTEIQRGLEWFSSPFTPDGTQFVDAGITDMGAHKASLTGKATNVTPIDLNQYNTRYDKLFAAGWNGAYKIGATTVALDLGYSRIHRHEQSLESYAGYGLSKNADGTTNRTYDTIGYDINPTGFSTYSPGLDYADSSAMMLGDPAAWGGWGHDGAIRFPDVRDRMYTADLRSTTDLANTGLSGLFSSIEMGINYSDRRKDKTVDEYDLFLKNGRQPVALDPADILQPTSLGFAGIPGILSYNANAILDKYYDLAPIKNSDNYNKNWSIHEKLLTTFAMANIETQLGSVGLRGNVGVQIIHTEQASSGYSVPGDINSTTPLTPAFSTVKDRYSDVLPSINLVFDLGSNLLVRAAAGKTEARPRLDDMRSSVSAGVDQTTLRWNGSGGNPHLRPWIANAYDLTIEKYFGNRSYVSAAAFYKDLKTYIYNETVQFDFSNVPNTSPYNPISPIGALTRPVNGKGGNIRGLEFSGTFDFGLLFHPLTGLGVTGSEALTWTGIKPSGPDSSDELPGFSHVVRNITAYYETGGFSTRISQRYRSKFRGEVVQLFTSLGYVEVAPDKQWDAQIGYTFQKGSALAGLGFTLQANNVFNSPYRTRTTRLDGTAITFLPEVYEEYGRQLLFGVNMKF